MAIFKLFISARFQYNSQTWLTNPQMKYFSSPKLRCGLAGLGPLFSKVPNLELHNSLALYLRNVEILSHQTSQSSCFKNLLIDQLFKTGGLHFDNWLFGPEKFLELSRNRETGPRPCSGAVTSLVTSCSHCSAQLTSFICRAGRSDPKVYPYKACLVTTEEATWPCGYEAGLKIPNSSSALTMPPGGFVLDSLWSAGSLVL